MFFSLMLLVVVLLVSVAGYFAWQKHSATAEKLRQATVLTEQQATDKNVLQNKLDVSKQNAEMLASFVKQAQTGQVQPVNYFTVQAPSLPVATQQVAERIDTNDPTLPPQVLEKTDRTVVVSNANKTPASNYDVGVFKVNNYRNWEWSIGYGQHGGDRYIPVELQRNFSKDAAVSAEYHFGGREKGFEVKYTRKTDKLFILF
ncbi:MAG: hypothetical protein H6Q68_3150 [Firmicutes bacterium]|nr:hypothetical protein [Bacillota bacterium]